MSRLLTYLYTCLLADEPNASDPESVEEESEPEVGKSFAKNALKFLEHAEYQRLMQNGYVEGFNPLKGTFSHSLQDGILGDQMFNPTYSGNTEMLTEKLYAGGKKEKNEAVVVAEDKYLHSIFPIFRIQQAIAFVNVFKMYHVKAAGIELPTPAPPATIRNIQVVLQRKAVVKLALQPGLTWCFSNCSNAVHAMVTIIGRHERTRDRVGQLIGWHCTISTACVIAGQLCNSFIDIFCWHDIILLKVWKSLAAKMDTRGDITVWCKQHWRSHVADTDLHILKLLWIVAYDLERVAFNEKSCNVRNHKISLALQSIKEAMKNIPLYHTIEMLRPLISKKRYALATLALKQKFRPYRYFLGTRRAAGTGKDSTFLS